MHTQKQKKTKQKKTTKNNKKQQQQKTTKQKKDVLFYELISHDIVPMRFQNISDLGNKNKI